ncbi:MAG: M20/M25/M40 family metallo-hydrolase, partial [Calditrichaeota bacterium]
SRNADIDDAVNRAPGANDDGSGVAAILELARVFSQFTFESTVMFVAFTGEEEGLFGSRALAADLKASNVNVVGMVTNDIIGNVVGGSGQVDSLSVRCFSDNPSDSPHRQLARYMKLQGEAYLPGFTVRLIARRDRPGRGGDHFAFNEQGYTAARLTEPEDNLNHQHNMDDLPEFMSFPYLTKVVKVNAAYLASWADAPESPTNVRLTPQGGQQLLSWDKNAEAGLSYLVAFRGPESASYDSLVAVAAETQVALDPAPLPDGVFISVSGVDAEGNESVFSQEVVLRK